MPHLKLTTLSEITYPNLSLPQSPFLLVPSLSSLFVHITKALGLDIEEIEVHASPFCGVFEHHFSA